MLRRLSKYGSAAWKVRVLLGWESVWKPKRWPSNKEKNQYRLFIDRMADLYKLTSRNREKINKGEQPVGPAGLRDQYTMHIKGVGMRDHATVCLKMSLTRMW